MWIFVKGQASPLRRLKIRDKFQLFLIIINSGMQEIMTNMFYKHPPPPEYSKGESKYYFMTHYDIHNTRYSYNTR